MTIFTETTFRRSPQGGMNADATGPFGEAAIQRDATLGAQPHSSNSHADDLLVRLAGPYRAREEEGSGLGEISSSDVQAMFAARGDRVRRLAPNERIGQAFQDNLPIDTLLADVSPGTVDGLVQAAHAANAESLINASANVALASPDTRAAISGRTAYSGSVPGPEQFAAVFGAEEGGKQYKTFKWRADVSPYLASMRVMPASDIDTMLDVAMPARNPYNPKKAPAQYKQEQARYDREMAQFEQKKPRYDLINDAAALILQDRQVDPAAYVRQVLPGVDAAWKQVAKPEDFGAAVAQSFAAQRQLGIKNVQPLPLSVAKDLIKTWSDSSVTPDAEEAERQVLEAVPDPKQRAAVAKQLANIRAAQTETPAGASDGEPDTNEVGTSQPVRLANRQFAKVIDLSPADILRLKKTLMTEWVVKDGDDEAKGIIDTILNRLASKHWGNDVSQVVNSWAQFSDVNSVRTLPHGRNNVDQPHPKGTPMDRNFARALALVLKSEGGWSDNPADPGGATMKGVTLANFRRYVKADASKADLKTIGDDQVATVYRRFYWDAVAGAELPDGVDYAVFDFAVNSGPGRAAKYLQASVGVSQDGRIGPATLAAAWARPAGVVIDQLCDARLAFLRRLPAWATFGRGWSDRVKSVRAQALLMSAPLAVPAPVQPATPASGPAPRPPENETPAGNPPAAEPASPAPAGSGIPVAAKAGGVIAACLLFAYAAWHHIAVALQGIF